jgi:hypothetical protein
MRRLSFSGQTATAATALGMLGADGNVYSGW